ncbi:MAG: DUF2764 family protein [Planctomycetota bacterium]
MIRRRYYYMLMVSLPYLPRFDRAERLPINRDRLQDRLRMLEPDDADRVASLMSFRGWADLPRAQTPDEMERDIKQVEHLMGDRRLRPVLEFPVDQRTIMAALRRRRRGLPAPAAGERWGLGPWVEHIRQNWEHPDFKLGAVFPWVPQARAHLDAGEALALSRLLMGLVWDRMGRITEGHEFEFRAVLAYLLKWDIVQRWLSYDKDAARIRFEELLLEAVGEHNQFRAPARSET